LKLNNISNVETYNFAISDTSCIKNLSLCISHNGLHTLSENPLRFSDVRKIEVQCETLDSLFYDRKIKVDFLKIDTEGWEFFVFLGGIKTIKNYRPIIQLEWNMTNMNQCNVDIENFINLITELEYEFLIKGDESILIPKKN
jgi:FkbM family methyltransferase